MRRILSIWLPQLPLNRLARHGDLRVECAFAVIAEIKNAWRLTHVSAAAQKAGVTPGLSLPDARAICPELLTEPSDPVREAALLRAMWRWADTLSPFVSLDPPDGLLLDVTGCSHLFGGEAQMGDYARTRLTDMQVDARIGIADTKGVAWALARFGEKSVEVARPGNTGNALKGLPLAGLNLPPALITELRRTGLQTIDQLSEIKSAELARRFGLDVTKVLARTLGHTPDPITPKSADPIYAARMTLPDPIGILDDLNNVLERLTASVCHRLKAAERGARRFQLTVRCVDTGDHVLTVGLAKPCAEAGAVMQQFAKPLDELKIEFGADWFRLLAKSVEPIQTRQASFDNCADLEDDTAQIISTLGNRLGFDRVRHFTAEDSHLPEREFAYVEAINRRDDPVWQHSPRKRPIRLYKNPERLRTLIPGKPPKEFEWRQKAYEIKKASGPERLTPEWWRDESSATRDYWRVQTQSGVRLWLMTYPAHQHPNWFVAGKFP